MPGPLWPGFEQSQHGPFEHRYPILSVGIFHRRRFRETAFVGTVRTIREERRVLIEKAVVADAARILTLQRLAFQSEADLYGDDIAPLTQSLVDLEKQFDDHVFLKAVVDGAVIGSVRAATDGVNCWIGRLMVHSAFRQQGIGTRLMVGIEGFFPTVGRFELFTGSRSTANIRFYEKLGYRPFRIEVVNQRLTRVFMAKERWLQADRGVKYERSLEGCRNR